MSKKMVLCYNLNQQPIESTSSDIKMKKEEIGLEEELDDYLSESHFLEPKRIARIAIFIALSAVGALVKAPSPTGTVALDACPGFFSEVIFGAQEGSAVISLGHLLTTAITGFPLGVSTHFLYCFSDGFMGIHF